jgi:hypothetical protein
VRSTVQIISEDRNTSSFLSLVSSAHTTVWLFFFLYTAPFDTFYLLTGHRICL